MRTEFLAAERAGAVSTGIPYGLLIGEDLLPFFLVVLLLGSEGARPRVDLREAETDCGFEPVLRDILCRSRVRPGLRR